jgi:hypothetical protein
MRPAVLNRITIVWVGLLSLTILSLVLIRGLAPERAHGVGPAAVMIIAFTKARVVGLEYMALRNAPWILRLLFEGWIVVIGTAMVVVSVHAN